MKTIVLVVPPTTPLERYGRFQRVMGRGVIRPPLGLLSIGAVLRQAGHRVHLVDALARKLNSAETIQRIRQLSPQIVGFSAYSISIFSAAELASQIKAADEEILTVIGGPHVTAVPEETMERFRGFDVGVIGEGERTIAEVAEAADRTALRTIKGLIVRDGEALVTTERRSRIQDLSALPFPAWELLQGFPSNYPLKRIRYRQYPVGDLCTSRGCPYQCSFCDKSVFGSQFRAFSPAYVIEAIDRLRRCSHVREIMFKDDLLMFQRERLIEICAGLLQRNWGLTWSCMGRADAIDPELALLMKKAGCWQISYGIESANERILHAVNKSLRLESVEYALRITREAGISPRGFFILGLPFETEETMRKTMDFAKRAPLDDINVALLTPFPGTQLYDRAETYGVFDRDWRRMNKLQAVFVPFGLEREALERNLKRFYVEFYARPKMLFKNARVIVASLLS
jgi:radical SAM superfamily enzyme YgiQ (UPF0313 family)